LSERLHARLLVAVTQERKKRKKIEKNLPENTGAGPALEEEGEGGL